MTARSLAALVLRVWGLVFLAEAVAGLPFSSYVVAQSAHFGQVAPGTVVAVAGHFLAGLLLVFLADAIVGWVIIQDPGSRGGTLDARRLAATALAVVGILMIVDGVRRAVVASVSSAWPMSGVNADFIRHFYQLTREQLVRSLILLAAGVVIVWRVSNGPVTDDYHHS